MTVTVKTQSASWSIPPEVKRQSGIKPGDVLEFRVSGGIITILPKLPTADEYTPAERKIIDAQLSEAWDHVRTGRVSPKFDTVDEMLASLKSGRKSAHRQR